MSFDVILHLIKNEMGLSPESIGVDTVERIVKRRMAAISEINMASYSQLVESSADEKQALFNDVSVPETWFFRDHEPFKVLSKYVAKLELGERPLNILSIPCSSGEEPYSIAMVLNDLGLGKNQFRIDAVDISTEVLKKARRGVYSNNSFRGKEIAFRDKYFKHFDGTYVISDEIKSTVTFINSNVIEDGFMSGKGPYDVVFCRNLLIYFDYEAKCQVLATLHGLMSQSSLLVLGHAETGRMPTGLFESLHLPGSFAYKMVDASLSKSKAAKSVSPVSNLKQPVKSKDFSVNVTSVPDSSVKSKESSPDDIDAWLDHIQVLADSGNLQDAITECDALIKAVPDSAQGYYLRGVILLAFDADAEAIDSFKKAVYLDPKDYQSLIQLAVLYEEQGELRVSENYRARADRLRNSVQVSNA